MKFILTFLLCSVIDGNTTCLPPFQSEVEYIDAYECMLDGYNQSYNKIVELAVKNVVEGNKIKNIQALSNPESLKQFKNLTELKKK